jgi:hypothetical protein
LVHRLIEHVPQGLGSGGDGPAAQAVEPFQVDHGQPDLKGISEFHAKP